VWCENNRLTISTKSKVMVFHESRKDRATRGITQWIIRRDFPLLATPLPIDEVSHFVYIGITVDPTLNYGGENMSFHFLGSGMTFIV
jgi:hypothetical protein